MPRPGVSRPLTTNRAGNWVILAALIGVNAAVRRKCPTNRRRTFVGSHATRSQPSQRASRGMRFPSARGKASSNDGRISWYLRQSYNKGSGTACLLMVLGVPPHRVEAAQLDLVRRRTRLVNASPCEQLFVEPIAPSPSVLKPGSVAPRLGSRIGRGNGRSRRTL